MPPFINAAEVVIRSKTECELADEARKRGNKIVQSGGRYWSETVPGFFEPMHWLGRTRLEQMKRPYPICWGFRSALHSDEFRYANGNLPLHLLGEDDLDNYRESNLPPQQRRQLRKSRRAVQIVQILDPQPFLQQGYDVLKSAVARTNYGTVPDFDRYCENLHRQFRDAKRIMLAGLIDGHMGGYFILTAVDDVAYIDTALLATEFLPAAIGTALAFESAQVARRSAQIRYVVYGLHSIEDSRLGVFKEGMGFKVCYWPARYRIPRLVGWFIGWRWPHKLYRLTGRYDPLPRIERQSKLSFH